MKKMIFKYRNQIALFIVFLIAAALRMYRLGNLPFEPHEDEILVGYVGRYILENGRDIYDNPWPLLYFDKFGDYYIVGPMYLAGLATYLFGINEFAVRFPAALFGSLVVVPVYILTQWITKNKIIGLIASLGIALMPWHIVLSRTSAEGVIGSTIFLIAIILILHFLRNTNLKFLFIAILLFLFSYGIYHPFRLYTPLVFLPIFLFIKEARSKRNFIILGSIATLFLLITLYISSTPWGKGRFVQTSIFSELSGVDIKIHEQIFNTGENKLLTARIFHNKPIGFAREFIKQYLSYFSPSFLFMGEVGQSRYTVPDQGLLYLTYLIALVLIFVPIGTKPQFDNKYLYFFLALLIIAPIPAAFTYYGSPSDHRSLFMSVLLAIPVSLGAYRLSTTRYGKIGLTILCVAIFGELLYFWHQYSVQSDIYLALRRNDGQREVISYLTQHRHEYNEIILPSEGAMALYYLFYTKDFNGDYIEKFKTDARIDQINNIHFLDVSCPTSVDSLSKKTKILVIDRHQCNKTESFKELEVIKGKNSLLGFKIYSR